ncbi:uncharacterized protein VP01_3428g1 [Puccinia sorghi]|uniref:Uncharacterized protein n=1 Tax=Puccinia sorghi TaxID=27349 RepID=A0A0L6UWI2_9BASI|nr:uncharacterized protein VP01_3428g1 [Puccinia sorghi]
MLEIHAKLILLPEALHHLSQVLESLGMIYYEEADLPLIPVQASLVLKTFFIPCLERHPITSKLFVRAPSCFSTHGSITILILLMEAWNFKGRWVNIGLGKFHLKITIKCLSNLFKSGVLSLANKSLKFTNRRGIPSWSISLVFLSLLFRTAFPYAFSMAFTAPKSAELVIGGANPELVLINASTGTLVPRIDISLPNTSSSNTA